MKPITRQLHVQLSDWHLGARTHALHQGFPYSEPRRIARVAQAVCNWKLQHRAETELYVHFLGDGIEGGKKRDPESARPLAEQQEALFHYLAALGNRFEAAFPRGVTWHMVPGNHGRDVRRHPEGASVDKWDGPEWTTYKRLQDHMRGAEHTSVQVHAHDYYMSAFGRGVWCTHGDTGYNAGNPMTTLNMRRLAEQVYRLRATLPRLGVVMLGHHHILLQGAVGGVRLFINGSLIPVPYARAYGTWEDRGCGQHMWETHRDVRGYSIVGHTYSVEVGPETDKNAKLDKVLKAFKYGD